jgi:hypothetical protein
MDRLRVGRRHLAQRRVSRLAGGPDRNGATCKLSMLVSVLPTCAVSWMRTSIRAAASLHEVDVIA